MAMTYAQLVTAVTDYTQNTFDTTTINTMIQQAEQRIYNTVQIANLRKNVTGVLSSGNKYLACPADFLSTYSLAVYPASGTGDYLYLLNKDVNFMRDAYPNPATTGKPKHYAIFGPQSANVNELSFILGPTPDANYNAELHYYYYPESIVVTATTWLGDNFDSALLYGTLAEAGTYMKSSPEDNMYKLYQERYVQAIALLKNLGDGKQRMDAYRDGQVRVPVS
jgi:hypothetical protein